MRKLLLIRALPAVVVALAGTYFFVVELSALGLAAAKAFVGVAILYTVVKYGHNEINAIRVMKDNPITYGLIMLAYSLVIAGAICGS
ncbi:MAG: hypothetical protein QXO86_01325 [Nitrososphaerota archaeon]